MGPERGKHIRNALIVVGLAMIVWLVPGGDYLLSHFERRGPLELDLPLGPKWRRREQLITELAPLRLVDERTLPMPAGPLRGLGENRIIYLWRRRD